MEYIADLEKAKQIAASLAKTAKIGDCFCLVGDLGSGKTEFARAFIHSLHGEDTVVPSPTFNIVQVYGYQISHFDLYRIEDQSELEEIGLEEALENSICLIEWPEIAEHYLPEKRCVISLEILEDGRRKLTISNI